MGKETLVVVFDALFKFNAHLLASNRMQPTQSVGIHPYLSESLVIVVNNTALFTSFAALQFSVVWPSNLATLAALVVDKYSRIYMATCEDRCRSRSLGNNIRERSRLHILASQGSLTEIWLYWILYAVYGVQERCQDAFA
jgi:hypothetical protein